MAQILPRFYRHQQAAAAALEVAKIIEETGAELPPPSAGATAAGAWEALRGFPVIGRGVSGATRHTDPVRALLAKEPRR